jgi:hypothetical protein
MICDSPLIIDAHCKSKGGAACGGGVEHAKQGLKKD